MNVSVRAGTPWQHILDIQIPADEVESRLDEVAREVQRRAVLPGFRRGKVPLHLVRQNFADSIEQRFFETTLPAVTSEAVRESKLNPVVPPLVRELRFQPGEPLSFEAVVDVKPELEARDWKKLPLTRRSRPIDAAAVAQVMDRLREESAVFVDVDRVAARGDLVLADSVRLDVNGRPMGHTRAKGIRLEIGAPGMLPELESGLIGARSGDARTIAVSYPEDHQAEELRGRTWSYQVRVRKIQDKKLRELDDTFARDVFKLSSVEELKERVRINLEAEEQSRTQRELDAAATDELVRRNALELPERLVAFMLDRVVREAAQGREVPDHLAAEMSGRYRPGVERSLRRELILDAIARQEQLSVSDEEIAAEIDRIAAADPRQAARVRARYADAERRRTLGETLTERKAMGLVIESAEVRDEVMSDEPMVVPAAR
ncbi:MAG: trigger factor [Candidatus Eisenbacteria bacterium]|uniref:Trigger factor n=1 Tax=Eiseniibacteriota bacterium TaxID=2212470 RepID=A0A849SGA6_UNCEI|nr:trigger factor [Candidatus Eisenbacteria bacterium]